MVLAISLLIAPLSWINYKLWLLPAWIALSERSPNKAWIIAIWLLMIAGVQPLMAAWGVPALAVLTLVGALWQYRLHAKNHGFDGSHALRKCLDHVD